MFHLKYITALQVFFFFISINKCLLEVMIKVYSDSRSSVRTNGFEGEKFAVNVGVQQGWGLCTYFSYYHLKHYQESKTELPWELLYTDDLVLMLAVWKYNQNEVEGCVTMCSMLEGCR